MRRISITIVFLIFLFVFMFYLVLDKKNSFSGDGYENKTLTEEYCLYKKGVLTTEGDNNISCIINDEKYSVEEFFADVLTKDVSVTEITVPERN